MKKFIAVYLTYFLTSTIACHAQIVFLDDTRHEQEKVQDIIYDSLRNEPTSWQECQSMIGQSIIVCPKSKDLQIMGYRGFYNSDETVYCPTASKKYSIYDSLDSRRFKIIDATKKFYLTIADNRDTLLYKWIDGQNYAFTQQYLFITEGFVEKQNRLLANERFVYKGGTIKWNDPINKDQIEISPGNIFTFEKIVILPKNNPEISICALLKTSNNTHVAIPLSLINSSYINKDTIDKYISRYGKYWVDIALSNKIRVGMPLELVLFSWGTPSKINRSSHGAEQWCYNRQYVYIKGGKVIAWN